MSRRTGLKFVYEGSPWTDIEAIKSEEVGPNPVSVGVASVLFESADGS